MKRYWLFSGTEVFEPSGGMFDFNSDHDTIEDAKAALGDPKEAGGDPWAHVLDSSTGELVAQTANYDRRREGDIWPHWSEPCKHETLNPETSWVPDEPDKFILDEPPLPGDVTKYTEQILMDKCSECGTLICRHSRVTKEIYKRAKLIEFKVGNPSDLIDATVVIERYRKCLDCESEVGIPMIKDSFSTCGNIHKPGEHTEGICGW